MEGGMSLFVMEGGMSLFVIEGGMCFTCFSLDSHAIDSSIHLGMNTSLHAPLSLAFQINDHFLRTLSDNNTSIKPQGRN